MNDLRVTTVQTSLVWEDAEANRQAFTEHLMPLKGKTDLILLPEMFSTGFSMNAEALAETMDGPTVKWMAEMAKHTEAVITGSIIIKDQDRYFNRLIWITPNGIQQHYDKRHLFTMAGEHEVYSPGSTLLITEVKGWRVCPLVCYDLRFPVWSRNTEGCDLMFYVASWPQKRDYAWKSLLRARAIENQCFVIGLNRVGEDGNGFSYSGDSTVIPPLGDRVLYACSDKAEVVTHALSRDLILEVRDRFPFLLDADSFKILP